MLVTSTLASGEEEEAGTRALWAQRQVLLPVDYGTTHKCLHTDMQTYMQIYIHACIHKYIVFVDFIFTHCWDIVPDEYCIVLYCIYTFISRFLQCTPIRSASSARDPESNVMCELI